MRNRLSRRSRRSFFSRLTGNGAEPARRAPRRREAERLEPREMLTANGTPTDEPFFIYQWNLESNGQNVEFDPNSPTFGEQVAVDGQDINVVPAWNLGYSGQGVQIAILAGGFDLTHPDIEYTTEGFSSLLNPLLQSNTPGFTDVTDSLGTALAGVVGAADNGIGTIGIAYGADIIPIRIDPGPTEAFLPAALPTIDAINEAIRFQAGFIQDGDGDGVPDDLLGGSLVQIGVDSEGRGIFAQDPSLVTDVYLHSGVFIDQQVQVAGGFVGPDGTASPRVATTLPVGFSTSPDTPFQEISIVDAIRETALGGRARFVDLNGDGFIGPEEISSLGAIHVVPAGDDGGRGGATPPFDPLGNYASSQYNQLANSIYTITVGGIDYDGQFENDATGTFTGTHENGTNVLIVAPTGTNDVELATTTGLTTGLVTPDLQGEDGANALPVFNFEFDGDYFPDTDYTGTATGSEFAAAQAAAVIGLMLEANPNLSQRDVQQILLMSARQADQFDETWITNQVKTFEDILPPIYAYYSIDTDGDGTVDIENALLPNSEYDPIFQDFIVERGYFLNDDANVSLGVPYVYAPEPVDFFFDDDGNFILGPFGFPLPRFDMAAGGDFVDPVDGLLLRAELNADGVAELSDSDEALPIVRTQIRQVNMAPEGEDEDLQDEEYISLLYDPNGNLVRPFVELLDDEQRPSGEFGPAPDSGPLNGLNIAGSEVIVTGGDGPIPDPVLVLLDDLDDATGGVEALITPYAPFGGFADPLIFENGVGYTVSHGYGNSLERVGYGHGVLDAELAVQLAEAWETNDLYLDESVTITTSILGGTNLIGVQAQASINSGDGLVQTVPGGLTGTPIPPINAGYYAEYFAGYTTTEVAQGFADDGGFVITDAPFFDPDGTLNSGRGATEIPFSFDPDVLTDFVSIEHIEFTTNIVAGDVDSLRIAIRSPDGTQSELSSYVTPGDGDLAPQDPQAAQGRYTSGEEAIDSLIGGLDIGAGGDFIDDTINNQLIGVTTEDALPNGQGYTWTTNRHWGELLSLQANFNEIDGTILDLLGGGGNPNGSSSSPDDVWTIVIENYDDATVTIGGQYQITVHGTKATGNRIQGKIGIDDNAQGIDGTEADENFNFERYVELGLLSIDVLDTSDPDAIPVTFQQTVVVDDPTDSVTYTNSNTPATGEINLDRIYKTVAPDTGVEVLYPVVDIGDYFDPFLQPELVADLENFFNTTLVGPDGDATLEVVGVTAISQLDDFVTTGDDEAMATGRDLGFYGGTPEDLLQETFSYRNFDYSQESFASGVTVLATQFELTYDIDGNVVSRLATGVVDRFVTGADGNYYFDVDGNPEPPVVGTPDYEQWLADFGTTFEYEISLAGVDQDRILTNEDGGDIGYFSQPDVGVVAFDPGQKLYTVGLNDDPDIARGVTSQVKDLNFLLTSDPELTNIDSSGAVYRDRNGDGVQQVGPEEGIPGVTVFHDANENGALDEGEAAAITDADGNYSFIIGGLMNPTDVSIRVDPSTVPSDFVLTSPASGEQTIDVDPGVPITTDFGVQLVGGEPAQVIGLVYDDLDRDGERDDNEGGISDATPVTVYIDTNGNGVFDPAIEPSSVTREDGSFVIESDVTGLNFVRIDLSSTPLTQTSPADNGGIAVNLVEGVTITDLEFGVFDGRSQDFGDLIGYPTLLSEDGARHVVLRNQDLFLGAGVDIDDDGFNTLPNALGDDLTGLSDEDGISLLATSIRPGIDIQFEIVAVGDGGVLNAWFDFNNDGDWDDPGEQIFTDVEDLGTGAPIRLTVRTPSDVAEDATEFAARFRYGPFGLSYTGSANSGEVEDYLFSHENPLSTALLVGDFDNDGAVTEDDRDFWMANFGSTDDLRADANGDGRVDISDYTVWRDAYESAQAATAAAALAAEVRADEEAAIDPPGTPALVTMPIVETELEPVSLDASAFSPLYLAPAAVESAIDESLADPAEEDADDDTVDAALLLWSFGESEQPEADTVEPLDSSDADAEEDGDDTDDALLAALN